MRAAMARLAAFSEIMFRLENMCGTQSICFYDWTGGGNISEYTISKEELLHWANEILAPTAQLAANGDGDFKAGEHCRFCKVRVTCRKLAEYNLSLAHYDFEPPATLDDIEIAAILAKADELVSWVSDVKEYALRQALSGVPYDAEVPSAEFCLGRIHSRPTDKRPWNFPRYGCCG